MMGEIPPGEHDGEGGPSAELRASYQDRDRVAELLRVAAGDGRLTAGELDERLEKALTARTCGELAALTRDLPATGGMAAGSHAVQPKDVVRIERTSGSARRDGRWVVPRRMEIKVSSGHVTLDFTEAVITQPALRIDAQVGSGRLLLVTKPGVVVDADDVSVRSGGVKVRAPWGPDAPAVLHVQVSGQVRSGQISARPPRRSLWQWLLRRPPPYQFARR